MQLMFPKTRQASDDQGETKVMSLYMSSQMVNNWIR